MKVINALLFLLSIPLFVMAQEIDENILENAHYQKRMETFKVNPLEKGQVIFFGNSLTEAGKWETYFPEQKPVNRGIAGDNTEGMLARICDIIAAKPAKFFIMAGVNDISLNRTNDVIIRQIKMLLRQIKAGSPDTRIYVQSVLPICDAKLKYNRMRGKEEQIEDLNIHLKTLCEEMSITFIDVYPHLLEKPKTLNAQYTGDGLHLNSAAYTVWAEQLRKYVEE